MSKPIIKVHNLETDEVIEREMNDVEFAQYQADQTAETARQAEVAVKIAQRETLLNKLGITEEEARLLIGGN